MEYVRPPHEQPFNSFSINLTNRCDTICKYCFRKASLKGESLPIGDLKRALAFFNDVNPGPKAVQLTGGEIFTYQGLFDVLNCGIGMNYQFRLQSNGLIVSELSDKELQFLFKPEIAIKISLDGITQEAHEFYRGKGTFERVMSSISRLAGKSRLGIRSVFHEGNINQLEEILKFCQEKQITSFGYNRLVRRGFAERIAEKQISEEEIVERVLTFLGKTRDFRLLNGTPIQAYIINNKFPNRDTRQFYLNWDGFIYSNQDCSAEDLIGTVFSSDLGLQFDVTKLKGRKIEPSRKVWDIIVRKLNE